MKTSMTEFDDEMARSMAISAIFSDFVSSTSGPFFMPNSLIKSTIHKKHGADRICFAHQAAITQVLLHALQNTIWIDTTGGGRLGQSHRSSIVLEVAPRRAMFAAASSVLKFWIPNVANELTHMETEAGGAESEHRPQ